MHSSATKLLLGVALVVTTACSESAKTPAVELHGLTMGTSFSITLPTPPADTALKSLQLQIENELVHIETIASTFHPDSELSLFNSTQSTEWIPVGVELCGFLADAWLVSQQTGGAFDLTIGPLVDLWGFGSSESSDTLPTVTEVTAAQQDVSYAALALDCEQPAARKAITGLQVDLSGWAKGHAVDRLAALLDQAAIENYLVEIGGEIRVKGQNAAGLPFSIGIEEPLVGTSEVTAAVRVTNASIATSGDYRNFREIGGVRYSHTIDPRTGWPIDHALVSVTVISDTTAYADAMATALLVLGPDAGMAFANEFEIAAYFIKVTPAGIQSGQSSTFTFEVIPATTAR